MGIWHIFEIKGGGGGGEKTEQRAEGGGGGGGGGGGRYNGTKGGVRFRNEGVLTILFTNYEAT